MCSLPVSTVCSLQLQVNAPSPSWTSPTITCFTVQDLLTADEGLAEGFRRVRFFVLDEADRLLEPSFESELRIIAGALPAQRQTLLFSATLTRSLAMLQASSLRDAHIFQVGDSQLPLLQHSGSRLHTAACQALALKQLYLNIAGCLGMNKTSILRILRAPRGRSCAGLMVCGICAQAYEGLETAKTLREEYVFIPAKVRELYLAHMLETLEEQNIR